MRYDIVNGAVYFKKNDEERLSNFTGRLQYDYNYIGFVHHESTN